ncbi:hypothetical protein H2248_002224 [Termitomyces sp. 'cryptogamus']|nr:hypothetical protein H2248_002224 [Termitomyces sp. 'cryptogamus']
MSALHSFFIILTAISSSALIITTRRIRSHPRSYQIVGFTRHIDLRNHLPRFRPPFHVFAYIDELQGAHVHA